MSFVLAVFITESGQDEFEDWLETSLRFLEVDDIIQFVPKVIKTGREENGNNNIEDKIYSELSKNAAIIIDLTLNGNEEAQRYSQTRNIPYLRINLSINPILEALNKYLRLRHSSNLILLVDDQKYFDQLLYYAVNSIGQSIIIEKLDKRTVDKLKSTRPTPEAFAILANTTSMKNIFNLVQREHLLKLTERWYLIFTDFNYDQFSENLPPKLNLIKINKNICCHLQEFCSCPGDFTIQQGFLAVILRKITQILSKINYEAINGVSFQNRFNKSLEGFENLIKIDGGVYKAEIDGVMIEMVSDVGKTEMVASYNDQELRVEGAEDIKPIKAFYRVGTTTAIPWSFQEKTHNGVRWTGFCIDLIHRLSELMDFDYELVVPQNGTTGKKGPDGKWNGVIGDVAEGITDLAITALVMRSDGEEVIDYVPPYFENSGISIVMRKPVRKTSLFKFMTVLKLEVWLSIIAVLTSTALTIWLLDRYSPYSAKNKRDIYNYNCREFSLKECFWFALTSFTPQGGGEPPKSLSSRVLVTAYWLFAVLMLATFTANLAAFLTVERMQTPVQSLDQLARQSRINYTVVNNSDIHEYFINMKFAEDTLHRMWKELSLNATTEDTRYRVWDYPIREQYAQILLAIDETKTVPNASEGFRIVNEGLDGDFAFIHDSSEIKYEISRNCNLTEVGVVFAEKPYTIVVQQGSHLTDKLSNHLLDLQKARFLADLQDKYWNNSARGSCEDDDSEGISLASLGGVFIGTLFGLALALATMGVEIFFYKRNRNRVKLLRKEINGDDSQPDDIKPIRVYPKTITIGENFTPKIDGKLTPKLSQFSVEARKPLGNLL